MAIVAIKDFMVINASRALTRRDSMNKIEEA